MMGETLEKVTFLRDEMANMAWAVEAPVPSALGGGLDGYRAANETQPPLSAPPPLPEGVEVSYELGTDVPWNWRPFSPVHLPGSTRSIKLRRSRMPGTDRPIRGRVLRVPGPYDLFEEEVPRAGAQVRLGFQRTRWTGGAVHLWLGRRAQTGRGEGSSGLVFGQVTRSTCVKAAQLPASHKKARQGERYAFRAVTLPADPGGGVSLNSC